MMIARGVAVAAKVIAALLLLAVSSFGFALLQQDKTPSSACPASTESLAACDDSPTPANPLSSLTALPVPPLAPQSANDAKRRSSRGSAIINGAKTTKGKERRNG